MTTKVGDMTEAEIINYLSDFLVTKGEAEEIIRKEQSGGTDELKAVRKRSGSNDPDDYALGVKNPAFEDSTGDYQNRELASSSDELDKYGTGEVDDTSRAEYKRRQREKKQAELVADALEERQN